jgi:hypothetical protein
MASGTLSGSFTAAKVTSARAVVRGVGTRGRLAAMSQDQPAEKPKHRWLAWVGLQEPPADPDSWVPVATGQVDDSDTGASDYASAVVQALAAAQIEAHQRPYVVPDSTGLAAAVLLSSRSATDRVHVAVLVHARDVEHARTVVGTVQNEPELGGRQISEGEAALWLEGAIPGS